ncbi:SGNH/GDSL hydrolase family protein [Sediminicola luteus]|uniref:G-D-S-L family lipolytic protein n=1 Tax=Sediminicola luteus TaxID=319238 RepID=A0A2A4G4L0_9FLAO|nr:SGNH/GDSL hydrolase family protein [Sediminicola luteus]PCE63597.1 G-D-S-L family lipolytic protein [Sediminicola luteus]
MKKYAMLLAAVGLVAVSCNDHDFDRTPPPPAPPEPVDYTSGTADVSNYVSIGNSLTAGFSDGALFVNGQDASFPNMLATQFKLAGGGNFNLPYMADNLGGATLGGQPVLGNRLILSFATGSPAPTPVDGQGATEISNVISGPFNNMGVPGAKSFHLAAPGYGNVQGVPLGLANPYYARMASAPDATIIGDALAQQPTFFTLWIGNNDVLSYATAGGDGEDHNETNNIDPSTYGGNDLTNINVFNNVYNQYIQGLMAGGAKGVLANVPDVTTIPFFTTVPHNPVPLDEATATLLNGAYAAYNGGLAQLAGLGMISQEELAKRTISFAAGANNAVVILDEDLTDLTGVNPALVNMRQATADDLLVFTAQTIIGTLADPNNPTSINGVAIPLADKWVLTPEEQDAIANATDLLNESIDNFGAQYDLPVVDANAYLKVVATTGIPMRDGTTVTATYATGGAFSLDGVHPSPRGYALLANLFLDAINAKHGSNFPHVDPLAYTGLYLQ